MMKLLFAPFVALIIADVFTTLEGSSIKIDIRSEGCNDPGKTPNTCGIAYIKVNDNEHSKKKRGHNVVVLDAVTGIVEHSVSFDTHGNGAAGNQLKGFLNGITGDKIILIAVQDEGSIHLKQAFDALTRVGGYDLSFLDYRGSYALVGHPARQKPSYVKQVQSKSGQGPSVISMTVPLMKNPFVDIDIRSEGCNDPNRTLDTCGIAYIKVDGKDHSRHLRGHNVVIVDQKTAGVLKSEAFDTHGDESAGNRLGVLLDAQEADKIILIAVQDEGSIHLKQAFDALKRIGGYDLGFLDYRGSYALVGHAGEQRPSYVKQVQRKSGQGPSVISMTVPLTISVIDEGDDKCEPNIV
ncbi:uncharacterized protein [Pocillopora verrucosa]|uniref:uncharacterized protein n=1 Tax=Pocillopora verrucosa TaxID=203993 RepID=UPI003340908D